MYYIYTLRCCSIYLVQNPGNLLATRSRIRISARAHYLFFFHFRIWRSKAAKAEKLRELTKFDFFVDEGRDARTLLAIQNGGKHCSRRRGIEDMQKEAKKNRVRPLLLDPGWLRGTEKIQLFSLVFSSHCWTLSSSLTGPHPPLRLARRPNGDT